MIRDITIGTGIAMIISMIVLTMLFYIGLAAVILWLFKAIILG